MGSIFLFQCSAVLQTDKFTEPELSRRFLHSDREMSSEQRFSSCRGSIINGYFVVERPKNSCYAILGRYPGKCDTQPLLIA
jgi:hypothetical protein